MYISVVLCNETLFLNKQFYYQVDSYQFDILDYGSIVLINFNNRNVNAYVVSKFEEVDADYEIKPIIDVVSCYSVDDKFKSLLKLLRKTEYISHYDILVNLTLQIKSSDEKIVFNSDGEDKEIQTDDLTLITNIKNEDINLIKVDDYNIDFKSFAGKTLVVVDNVSKYNDNITFTKGMDEEQKIYNIKKLNNNSYNLIFITPEQLFNNFTNIDNIVILDDNYFINSTNPIYNTIIQLYNKLFKTTIVYISTSPSILNMTKSDAGLIRYSDISVNGFNNLNNLTLLESDQLFSTDILLKLKDNQEQNNNSVLIYFNNDYAKSYMCNNCGYVEKCPNCNIDLNFNNDKLNCKYCGFNKVSSTTCDICENEMSVNNFGLKKVEEFLKQRYKNIIKLTTKTSPNKINKLINKSKGKQIFLIESELSYLLKYFKYEYILINNISSFYYNNDPTQIEKLYQIINDSKKSNQIDMINTSHITIETNYRDYFDKQLYNRKLLKIQPYFNVMVIDIMSEVNVNNIGFINEFQHKIQNLNVDIKSFIPLISKIGKNYRMRIVVKYKKQDIITPLKKTVINFKHPIEISVSNNVQKLY